jgi:NADP-dependent 3-hydroxy acid dehydrogenase YdfG
VPKEIFDAVQDTNVQGAANVARVVLPIFRRQQHGHLVLLGSAVGDIAVPGMTAYVVSKHAIRSFGRQLALENRDLSEVHITVVPLCSATRD